MGQPADTTLTTPARQQTAAAAGQRCRTSHPE